MNKTIMIATILIALLGGAFSQHAAQSNTTISVNDLNSYNQWRSQYKRVYLNSDEQIFRQSIFFDNLKQIDGHNANPQNTYTIGTNQFSDMTNEEFVSIILNNKLDVTNSMQASSASQNTLSVSSTLTTIAASVDWRAKGAVTAIKNQGQCGSCWAFSSSGLMESFNFIKNKKLVTFAEQQLVDCVTPANGYSSSGCNGGSPVQALTYSIKYGILQSSQYPYVAAQGKCKVTSPTTGFYPKSYQYLGTTSSALQAGLNISPVGVLVDATNWNSYRSGIFNGCSATVSLNHAVLAVGYDANGNWIIKNSWATTWGESGYMRLAAGNSCGIFSSNKILTA